MLFVFDLDGVIYRGKKVIRGAVNTINYLKRKGHKVTYATNNATLSREDYKKKLKKMGFECKINEIMCTSFASVKCLEKKLKKKKVFLIGEKGLFVDFKKAGANIITKTSNVKKVDYVIVGLDKKIDYEKLSKAQQYIMNGAKFIATNTDATWPAENKKILPGCGTIISALETASGRKPFIVGKPYPYMMKLLFKITGYTSKKTMVVGDRLETDVAFGKNVKAKTAIVLTGICTRQDIKNAPRGKRPDYIFKSINDMREKY